MGHHLDTRRRMIASRGRPMVLRRIAPNVPPVDLPLMGFSRDYRPEEVQGTVKAGDQRAEILNDELAAAGWPAPAHPMKLIDGGRTGTVGGARAVYEGAAIIGWSLWITG